MALTTLLIAILPKVIKINKYLAFTGVGDRCAKTVRLIFWWMIDLSEDKRGKKPGSDHYALVWNVQTMPYG